MDYKYNQKTIHYYYLQIHASQYVFAFVNYALIY